MAATKRTALLAGLAYVGLLLVLTALENQLIYIRGGGWNDWPGFPHEEFAVEASDGISIVLWHCPCPKHIASPTPDRPVVLYCHGNAGNISNRPHIAETLQRRWGADVVMFDYRGYGKSGGSPDEAGLYRDVRAVYDWLVGQRAVAPQRIVLLGESIGGGIATELATAVSCRGLVLERSFTSLPDVAARHFWYFPVRWIMRNRFANLEKIGRVKCPVYIASAERDEIVPFEHGQTLFERANEPKRYRALAGIGHNDAPGAAYYDDVRDFLFR